MSHKTFILKIELDEEVSIHVKWRSLGYSVDTRTVILVAITACHNGLRN